MPLARAVRFVSAGLPLICALAGCAGTAFPTLCNPGSESYQLAVAKKFDPYPDPSVGGDMTGARPRGFITPRADPDATKLQPFIPAAAGPPPGEIVNPPAAYSSPTGPVYPPAAYPAGTAPVAAPLVYPPPSVAPPPGTTYLPSSTTTGPPLGTSSSLGPPGPNNMPLSTASLAPIPAAPPLTSSMPSTVAYGTAISASSP
jgi:hypothetical protein